jgi:hypothetical protein
MSATHASCRGCLCAAEEEQRKAKKREKKEKKDKKKKKKQKKEAREKSKKDGAGKGSSGDEVWFHCPESGAPHISLATLVRSCAMSCSARLRVAPTVLPSVLG